METELYICLTIIGTFAIGHALGYLHGRHDEARRIEETLSDTPARVTEDVARMKNLECDEGT